MNTIEQAASDLIDGLYSLDSMANWSKVREVVQRHLTTLTKPLEDEVEKLQEQVKNLAYNLAHTEMELSATKDENKRLRKALELARLNMIEAQRNGIGMGGAIERAEQALTKPT